MRDVQCCGTCTLLKSWAHIFHELIEIEVYAYSALEHLKCVLLEKKVMVLALGDLWLSWWTWGNRQCLHCLNYQVSWEVTAYQTDHLMVVESCYNFVMRRRVEYFLNLLEEGLAVELSGWYESVLSQQDMFPTQCRIEVLIQQIKRSFVAALEYYLDCVLQIDGHFVWLKVVLGSLSESILSSLLLRL